MEQHSRSLTMPDAVEVAQSTFPSLKSNLSITSLNSNLPIVGSKSKTVRFQAHFLASRRLVDSSYLTPKQIEAKYNYKPRPPVLKILEANRRKEAMQKAAHCHRIVAHEDDVDQYILAAIEKADCVARYVSYFEANTSWRWS